MKRHPDFSETDTAIYSRFLMFAKMLLQRSELHPPLHQVHGVWVGVDLRACTGARRRLWLVSDFISYPGICDIPV